MRLLASLRSTLARLVRGSEFGAEVDDEIRAHIQHRADHLERSGVSRAEAERRARIEFGGLTRFKEESRDAAGGTLIESFFQDLRYAFRILRKSPGFTLVAIATLAFGIGANAVVFGVLNAVILRPLNVPEPQSFYGIQHGSEASSYESYPDYLDLRDRNRSFDGLAAYDVEPAGLDTGENPYRVWLELVSANYFDVLRLHPFLGRVFHDSDERGPNSAPYIVLTYTYWQNHFQNDSAVLGRTVQLNKHPFTIVGVAPPEFRGTLLFFNPDFFVPIVNQEQITGANYLNERGQQTVFMSLGHLKPGVTTSQAAEDLNSIGAYLAKTYPRFDGARTFTLARPSLYGDFLGQPAREFLTALTLLAALILLAACANLGSLFAARAADRSREVALRLALGASRSRILRALFTEALIISIAGGAIGLLGSVFLLQALRSWQPIPRFPFYLALTPDAHVYEVALFLSLASGFLFGAVPVRQVLRTDPYQIVKSGTSKSPGRRITLRDLLVAGQIAICAILVTSSLVAVRGLGRSLHSNFGFEPRNAILLETVLDMAGYRGDAVAPMQKRMKEAMQQIPGVEAVGLVDWAPLSHGAWNSSRVFTDQTTDFRPSNAAANPVTYKVSPDYFRAAGTTLLAGREFTWHDEKDAPAVAIINPEFARRLFGSTSAAMGAYFRKRDGTRTQVVGIAELGKYTSLTEAPITAMYLPVLQSPSNDTSLVVRSSRDPQQLSVAMHDALRQLDPSLPAAIETWDESLDLVLFAPRMATVSLGVLGGIGALLSITGVFGLAAYSVSKRKKELGIRIALGAQRREVLQAALGRALKLLAFGSAAGLILGILASRVLASIVYSATPRDPLVLAGTVFAMLLLGLLATWIPAQRALSLDPLKLLREE